MPPEQYVDLLIREIRGRASEVRSGLRGQKIDTIYFGGGTPSLIEPPLILTLITELANAGLVLKAEGEFTLEIDPRTVDEARLDRYLEIGVNRFSVGAQTFNPRLLQIAGREHSADDTVKLLSLLQAKRVNYTFDLLFALPTQTLAEVRADVARALEFAPAHISTYCLTVGDHHPMAKGRAPEEEQVEMFAAIDADLEAAGVLRYEISNYARPGFESRHNHLYWTDQNYWSLGTGAHSYFNSAFAPEYDWGFRFWNEPSLPLYERSIKEMDALSKTHGVWNFGRDLPARSIERLARHQALTDFSHTALRLQVGLSANALRLKFGEAILGRVQEICEKLIDRGLLQKVGDNWRLTAAGRVVANQVFMQLTFLEEELHGL